MSPCVYVDPYCFSDSSQAESVKIWCGPHHSFLQTLQRLPISLRVKLRSLWWPQAIRYPLPQGLCTSCFPATNILLPNTHLLNSLRIFRVLLKYFFLTSLIQHFSHFPNLLHFTPQQLSPNSLSTPLELMLCEQNLSSLPCLEVSHSRYSRRIHATNIKWIVSYTV